MEQIANNWPGLAEKVLAIPRCLSCGDGLRKKAEGLVCSGCGRKCSLVNGVLRFVDMQQYAGSVGFQSKVYARTQLDRERSRCSENAFRGRTGFRPEDLARKLLKELRVIEQPIAVQGRRPIDVTKVREKDKAEVEQCAG